MGRVNRPVILLALVLASSACADEASRKYVVRLDLDQIAAETVARDAAPGFETLDRQNR